MHRIRCVNCQHASHWFPDLHVRKSPAPRTGLAKRDYGIPHGQPRQVLIRKRRILVFVRTEKNAAQCLEPEYHVRQ